MYAISVRPPWPHAIMWLGKPVENRSRNIAGTYRGPLALHASQNIDPWAYNDFTRILGCPVPPFNPIMAGHVLGIVQLVDVHRPGERANCQPGRLCSPWAQEGHVHLVLADPRPLRYPMWMVGRLGLWQFDDTLLDGRWPDPDTAEARHG